MESTRVVQGRKIAASDIDLIRRLMADNPSWGRSRLSVELCERWQWRRGDRQPKDMACRTLLLKLERAGLIVLPPRRARPPNASRNRQIRWVPHCTEAIRCDLKAVRPLDIAALCPRGGDYALFQCLVSRYHYLGLKNTVGENVKYLVRARGGRVVGCVLFGSAAWKTAPRDDFIGWDRRAREANLGLVTNNSRLLVLPWVRVAHLASHLLSRVCRRVRSDWVAKYGHPIELLETFVERGRFQGTCYRAANWIRVGQTQGRSRNDRDRTIEAPVKDVYVYPLTRRFREHLCHVDA